MRKKVYFFAFFGRGGSIPGGMIEASDGVFGVMRRNNEECLSLSFDMYDVETCGMIISKMKSCRKGCTKA